MKVLVLINPRASKLRAQIYSTLTSQCPDDVELLIPSGQDRIKTAEAAVRDDVCCLLVIGGDGTICEGANLVAGSQIPIYIIPAGTGNDFMRSFSSKKDRYYMPGLKLKKLNQQIALFFQKLQNNCFTKQNIDLIQIKVISQERAYIKYATNVVNIGFDALVNRRANTLNRIPGSFRYIAALVIENIRFRPRQMSVIIDGIHYHKRPITLISLQNGAYMGGGMPLSPQAIQNDGLLDISIVTRLKGFILAILFPLIYVRGHKLVKQLKQQKISQFATTTAAGIPVYADGDMVHSGVQPAKINISISREYLTIAS